MGKCLDEHIRENLMYDGKHLYWKVISGRRRKGPVGNTNSRGYATVALTVKGKRKSLLVHRVIWFLHYGHWPENLVDHINGNKLDNRIENLREATSSQNARNRKSNSNSGVSWKGVTYHKRDKTYDAVVGVRGKNTYLGRFTCPREAALCYNHGAMHLFGRYARFNLVFKDIDKELLDGEA